MPKSTTHDHKHTEGLDRFQSPMSNGNKKRPSTCNSLHTVIEINCAFPFFFLPPQLLILLGKRPNKLSKPYLSLSSEYVPLSNYQFRGWWVTVSHTAIIQDKTYFRMVSNGREQTYTIPEEHSINTYDQYDLIFVCLVCLWERIDAYTYLLGGWKAKAQKVLELFNLYQEVHGEYKPVDVEKGDDMRFGVVIAMFSAPSLLTILIPPSDV